MRFEFLMVSPPWKRYSLYKRTRRNLIDSVPPKMMRAIWAFGFVEDCLNFFTIPSHVACLWATSKYTEDCKEYMALLGYEFHGIMIWVRPRWKGRNPEQVAEYLLIFSKGLSEHINEQFTGTLKVTFTGIARNRLDKPADAYDLIDKAFPDARKLQVYGRNERPGWTLFHRNENLI